MAQEKFNPAIMGFMFPRFAKSHHAQRSDRHAERIVRSRYADFDFVAMRNGAGAPRPIGILIRFQERHAIGDGPVDRPGINLRGTKRSSATETVAVTGATEWLKQAHSNGK